MVKEIITFDGIETEKHKFHHYKNLIFLNDVDIDNIFISKKISSRKKITNTSLVTWMNIKLNHSV